MPRRRPVGTLGRGGSHRPRIGDPAVAQLYPVICDCGRTHQVLGTSAGSDLPCGCGRTVGVPSLQRLRVAAGEPPAAAEVMIEALLRAGRLPEESHCLRCETATTDTAHVTVACERIEVKGGSWAFHFIPLLFGWFVWSRGPVTEQGRDITYRLPLRLCQECAKSLRRSETRELVRQVTLYRQLLEKYPRAVLSDLQY